MNIVFGRYLAGRSFVHQLDARNKIITLILMIFLSFMANSTIDFIILLALCSAALLAARIPVMFFLKGIRFFLIMILLTAILQLLFSKGGSTFFSWGIISITSIGLKTGIFLFLRFAVTISMATLFTLTTSSIEIANGLTFFLQPFRFLKLPVDDIVLTLSIALRFVPTIIREINTITNAQKSRGSFLNTGSIVQRIRAVLPVLTPFFLGSIKRAEDLATAMILRGYTDGRKRSKFRKMTWKIQDSGLLGFYFIISLIMVWL
ncbi:energy-coupling factor transporter transmembrane component T family protein [Oenococcus sicerae]|uniref:energy-coupling factor transporter transmembrane component T family protein n=1 Tax=Oenococcus sicerae TaxID=2203724 RepID=UPI0010B90B43|nr:Energy-coupling factor transporter transmembrane protein EcfT {ECO:0000255/HAMAP-Rule:MF_01461} [Oenococcus sicerae]